MRKRPSFLWTTICRDKYGKVKWAEYNIPNLLHDEGEQYFLQAALSEEQSVPASFFIGLDDRAALAEADTLASLSGEPVGNGYSRQTVNSDATDWVVSQVAGDYQAKSKTVRFTASGGAIPATGSVSKMFLTTSSDGTGKLIASVALSAARALADGDSLDTDITITLSE